MDIAEARFAVIKTGGKQYIVHEGDMLKVEKLDAKEGTQVTFGEVLLVGGNGEDKIGTPLLPGAAVEAEVMKQGRGDKVTSVKFKPKVRYYKKMGFRPMFTQVRITKIKS
jgi:large subunit ribosomal protein L21